MREKIYFRNSKGDKLCGILSDPNPAGRSGESIVVMAHGFRTSKNSTSYLELEKILNASGIAIFRFDFFGHGESEGKFEDITLSEAADDILNAILLVKSKGYKKIGLLGGSFGGAASIIAASRSKDLSFLALKSPVSDYLGKLVAQRSESGIREWKERGFIYYGIGSELGPRLNYSFFEDTEKISEYEAAKKIGIPTLIVHGDADESVPVEQSRRLSEVISNSRLEIIEGADHTYSKPEDFERVLRLIAEFIIEKLPKKESN